MYDPITYESDSFNVETKPISVTNGDVLFYGTITDSYGKTISTPCFKYDPNSPKVTEEPVAGVEPEITPSKSLGASEKWVYKEGGQDSPLACYYNPASGAYESYSEDTGAYNMVFEQSGDVLHYNEVLKAGFYYSEDKGLYYLIDENGVVDEENAIDEDMFVLMFGADADDFDNFDVVIASFIDQDEEESAGFGTTDTSGSYDAAPAATGSSSGSDQYDYGDDDYDDDYGDDDYDDDYDDDDDDDYDYDED